MAPHIGEPERKKHWLSLWHATVEILGDPTVGGGNANSNLQPYIKQSSCHRLATQKKQICPFLQTVMGPMVIISSGLPKKRRKFCPPLSKFLYIFKTFFF